jgi:hypothetical protein
MKRLKWVTPLMILALGATASAAQGAPAGAPPAGSSAAAGPSAAAPMAPMEAPKPNPALDQIKYFAGTWSCTGMAWVDGKEHNTTGKVTMAWDLDNFFMDLRYQERKTAANPHPITAVEHWGYSDELKRLIAGQVDSMGGYGTQSSAGWEGDSMVWTGDSHTMGMKVPTRDTFVRKGVDEVTHLGESQMNGSWVKQDQETCKRVTKK